MYSHVGENGNAERRSKANSINKEQQKFLAKKMSTERLKRVQEAAKQIEKRESFLANRAASSSSSSSSSSTSSSPSSLPDSDDIQVVLQTGSHYAFSFVDDDDNPKWEIGQLSVLKDKNGNSMIETALTLSDAREAGVHLVCSWFVEKPGGNFILGLVHPTRYSSLCCMCDVDLAIVDAEKKEYRLADSARRVQLDALNQLAQGTASEEAGTSSGSSASSRSSSSKKKRSRTTTTTDQNEAAGADPVLTQVARADGKRKATQSTR